MLQKKPDLPFEFDSLVYDTEKGVALRTLRGEVLPLTDAEVEAVEFLMVGYRASSMKTTVHAVDAAGRYIGRVDPKDERVFLIVESLPHKHDAVYDFEQNRWVRQLTAQMVERDVRQRRDALLRKYDFTQGARMQSRMTHEQRVEWDEFMQALADLPEHEKFPNLADEDWPVPPALPGKGPQRGRP